VGGTELTSGRLTGLISTQTQGTTHAMPSIKDKLERPADGTRVILETLFAPWGGSRICTDAYETSIEVAADLQLALAKAVSLEPFHSPAAPWAGMTRDVGATQLSAAHWYLDA